METLVVLFVALFAATPPDYAELKQRAEAFIAEKSFAKANAVYGAATHLDLTPEEKRWVEMRMADTAWRAEEAPRDDARKVLESLAHSDDHDRVYAEADESLGDYETLRQRNPNGATPWYTAALDWWAGSDDLPLARRRYLAIVFRMAGDDNVSYRYLPTNI